MAGLEDFERALKDARLRRFEDLLMRDIARMSSGQRRAFLRQLGPYAVIGVAPRLVRRFAKRHILPRLKMKLAAKATHLGIQLDTLLALEDAAK